MLQKLFLQLQKFSKENWWIYILLFLTLAIVALTGKGNFIEIVGIFLVNLMGAMCNMLMMSSYKDGKFKEGSTFILIANTLYTCIALYAWLHDGDMQYLFWQASFILAGTQTFMFYNYSYKIKCINAYSIALLNIIVLYSLINIVGIHAFAMVQSFGLAVLTLGLVVKNDTKRYFLIMIGNSCTVMGSLLILLDNYREGNILGVTVAYTLLGLSIAMYNYRILPEYISRIKHL